MDEDTIRRATLQQHIGMLADEQLQSVDPPLRPCSNAERVACLTVALGDVALAYREDEIETVEGALLLLAAETQLQLEAIERTRAL